MKISVIGAGSTYTPELVSNLSRLGSADLALHDIDAERLEVVGGLAARMLARQEHRGSLLTTVDLDRALDGADFVLLQIRVGGQEARLSDETAPLACGCIGQETTGAGGFAKAMRTVPVVLEIAERARELAAPGAWIVDFTNPVGIVTRALLDAGHRAVGLCNVAIGLQRTVARMLGVEHERLAVDQVGLNHLTWVRAVRLDGRDVLPDLLADHGDELAAEVELPRRLLDELGAIPSYYLRYFYAHDEVLAEQLEGVPRAVVVAEIERELLDMYRDPSLAEKPALLERRGGAFYSEAATGLVASLRRGNRGRARRRRPQPGNARRARGRRRGRGSRPYRTRRARPAPTAAARAGAARARPARLRLRAADGRGRGDARPGDREEGTAVAPVDRPVRADRAAAGAARGRGSRPMSVLLAIDGGNSKTDLALARDDGELLAVVRGPLSSPHNLGVDGSLGVLDDLLSEALAEAGLNGRRPVADVAEVLLAGVDFPAEEEAFRAVVEDRGWARRVTVRNDTFAVLRAGTERGWGVAVVSGAGINCIGVAPDGRQARFPALGPISGDWGGGFDLGLAALSAAARSEDGRGPLTTLEREVPRHFGLSTPLEVTEAIHSGTISLRRVAELAPAVLAEAATDPVAAGLVDRLAAEVVAFARAALARLELRDQPVEVLLGGGLLQAGDPRLHRAIETGVLATAPAAIVRAASSPPIVGAGLLGLDELGSGPAAQARLRAELGAAVRALRPSADEETQPARLNTSVERANG